MQAAMVMLRTRLELCFSLILHLSNSWATSASSHQYDDDGHSHPEADCNSTLRLSGNQYGRISSPHFPSNYPANLSCTYTFRLPSERYRLRITFNGTFHIEDHPECDKDYLHIGNNLHTLGRATLTSYRLCGSEAPREIVSRGHTMWVVFRTDALHSFSGFSLFYEVLPQVACRNTSFFSCSDVECVPRSAICDGNQDCSNGRDEYCGLTGLNSPCLMCGDGRCIHPRLPAYSTHRGKRWWWLCDEYPHCLDNSDERMDVCLTLQSRSSSLFECIPAGYEGRDNVSVAILTTQLCDGIRQCAGGEDETHPRCFPKPEYKSFKPEIIYIPVVAVIVFSICISTIYFIGHVRRRQREFSSKRQLSHEGISNACDNTTAHAQTSMLDCRSNTIV